MTEIAAEHQQPTAQAIIENPDLLMAPATLNVALYDPTVLLPAEQVDGVAGLAPETQNTLYQIQEIARREVIGPELSVALAKNVTRRISEDTGQEVQLSRHHVAEAADELGRVDRDFRSLEDDLPRARNYVQQLRDILSRPDQIREDEYRHCTAVLGQYAERYAQVMRTGKVRYEDAGQSLRGTMWRYEQMSEDLVRGVSRFDEIVAQGPANAAAGDYDPSVEQAAMTRGAATLAEHSARCVNDCQTESDKLTQARQMVGAVTESGNAVVSRVRAITDGIDTMPHVSRLVDSVDNLNRYLYQIQQYGPGTARLALEEIEQIEYDLSRIRNAMSDRHNNSGALQQGLTGLQESINLLNQSDLLAA